jgi:hypothetical protein
MARRKFSAATRKGIGDIMRAARARKKTSGGHVKFTKGERSTLSEIFKAHHAGRKTTAKKATPTKRKTAIKSVVKRKSPIKKAVTTRRKTASKRGVGRPAGFKHSPATIRKMRASHKARRAGKTRVTRKLTDLKHYNKKGKLTDKKHYVSIKSVGKKRKVGRPAGFKHSAATIKKMRASHAARRAPVKKARKR